jgi:hypothetical protein
MPLPTVAYTRLQLADYLHRLLGNTAETLGWSVSGGHYWDVLDDALLAYAAAEGASSVTIADATDLRQLRALARVEVWRAVVAATTAEHDYGTATARFARGQIHKQALAQLARAEADAAPYAPEHVVRISAVRHAHDPYRYWPDAVRVVP